ncbi:hypothetical protein J3Q64DRAFT_1700296 [Phycomyces blakesleeanus]|uniref:Uncharacterized protein n=2 Tax=Phycomyces blakesleeanus TaxID=4837 RepID=A0A163EF35_PHYB8|nr:hypothetical protein PHYBLDRAFT_163427 [Phycomyces blakesleeanus NRRL 1555(-)]OAD78310.1 hypothetical protein PHYBLDRAFT_163427 [Phycomyces blakesleeanus NRRL 1555(-)]|eukprot:XP_018296350.1 hypothetical protein PHYBLDRAFT_163427 [Phycomyces blakesleeanus NRRL 1555(-)]
MQLKKSRRRLLYLCSLISLINRYLSDGFQSTPFSKPMVQSLQFHLFQLKFFLIGLSMLCSRLKVRLRGQSKYTHALEKMYFSSDGEIRLKSDSTADSEKPEEV